MRGVNLLPSDLPRPQRVSFPRVAAAATVCALLFATSLVYTLRVEHIKELRRALDVAENGYARYVWLERDIESTRKSKEEMLARLAEARKQAENGLPAQDILAELPQVMPENVWLVQFALADDNKAGIEGEAASLQDVAAFILALESSDLFEDVHLLRASRSGEAGLLSFQAETVLSRSGGNRP